MRYNMSCKFNALKIVLKHKDELINELKCMTYLRIYNSKHEQIILTFTVQLKKVTT